MTQHMSYSDQMGEVQLVPGTLRGYRAWRWDGCCRTLVSVGWMYTWARSKSQLDAVCLNANSHFLYAGHQSPWRSCSCGYYASYSPWTYEEQAGIEYSTGYVHGAISAHGRIVLGTGGFRAQRVEVAALWGPGISEEIAEVYEVPWFGTLEEMLVRFPPPDMRELLKLNPPPPLFMNPVNP